VQGQRLVNAVAVLEEKVADALAHQRAGIADDAQALDVVVFVR
jgi:hypothetical protein